MASRRKRNVSTHLPVVGECRQTEQRKECDAAFQQSSPVGKREDLLSCEEESLPWMKYSQILPKGSPHIPKHGEIMNTIILYRVHVAYVYLSCMCIYHHTDCCRVIIKYEKFVIVDEFNVSHQTPFLVLSHKQVYEMAI